MRKIVLDLETQKEFAEVGGRGKNHLLKISTCGIYESESGKFSCFGENEIPKLSEILQNADQIIGFNIKDFDFEVLQPYLNFNINSLPYLDIIEDVQRHLGHRVGLDSIAQATLGTKKSGDGKQALVLWKTGQIEKLKKYCLDDVRITRDVYEYGLANKKILYRDFFDMKEIPVAWVEPEARPLSQKQVTLF